MKQCWRDKPDARPTAQEAAKCLLDPYVHTYLGNLNMPTRRSVREAAYVSETDEIWVCCDDANGVEVFVLRARSLSITRRFVIDQYQVSQC